MTTHKPLPSNPDLRTFRNRVQALMNAHASQDDGTPSPSRRPATPSPASMASTTGTPSAPRSSPPPPTLPARKRISPRSRPTTSSSRPSARATSTAYASSLIRTHPSRTRTYEELPPSGETGDGAPPGETRPRVKRSVPHTLPRIRTPTSSAC